MKKYICIAKCPELDYEKSRHCINTKEGIMEREETYHDYCPCGNVAEWIEFNEESKVKN